MTTQEKLRISTIKTSCFKKPLSVLVAIEWSDTETRTQVQVSWGCTLEGRMARRRTGYPNRQGNCNNENFAQFSCCETSIVKKRKALNFRNSLCPFSPTVSLYRCENLVMTERVRSQVQAPKMRFLQKIEEVT